MMNRKLLALLASSVAIPVAFVACGEDDDGGTPCSAETAAADCGGFACGTGTNGADLGICLSSCDTSAKCAAGYLCTEAGACEAEGSGQDDCTTDADCTGYKCDAGTCKDTCAGNADCADGFECDAAACQPLPSYRFIAIVSASPEKAAPNPGPDIDGVEVTRGGAAQAVSAVAKAVAGEQDTGNTKADSSSVLVADAKQTDGSCDLSDAAATFYSMGSNGSPTGFLILDMGATFEFATGDQIKVVELAKTNCNNITTDRSDGYKVFLCTSADAATAADIEAGCLSLGQSSAEGGEFTSTVQ